jgi:D-tyrosyl-tRNA(Tyr) deacylase
MSGEINDGLLVYLGVCIGDDNSDAQYLAEKTANLRIFADGSGKMNLSAIDLGKDILVVSQFTLCADVRKGRRPSYVHAAEPELAVRLYEHFISCLLDIGISVETGVFGGMMDVTYTNRGPVTILLDSDKVF